MAQGTENIGSIRPAHLTSPSLLESWCGGLPNAEPYRVAPGREASGNVRAPRPGTREAILSAAMRHGEEEESAPALFHRSHKSYPAAQTQDLRSGVPGSAGGGAHPPGSWVCRDNQAGHGGDGPWESEALRTGREEG